MNTENELLEKIRESAEQAYYNVIMDGLPLSKEYVLEYIKNEFEKQKEKTLVRRKEDD